MAEEDAAARAFNCLAAEVGVLRRAVEGFEAKLDRAKARNYDATLGHLREAVERAAERLDAMEQHPALRLTPDEWRSTIGQAARGQRDELRQELEVARRQVADAAGQVRAVATDVLTSQAQKRSEWVAGGVGAVAGLFLGGSLLLAGLMALPAGWHVRETLAAIIMREDRWTAGQDIARSAHPEGWARIMAGAELEKTNRAALSACAKAASQKAKSQRCVMMVGAGLGSR